MQEMPRPVVMGEFEPPHQLDGALAPTPLADVETAPAPLDPGVVAAAELATQATTAEAGGASKVAWTEEQTTLAEALMRDPVMASLAHKIGSTYPYGAGGLLNDTVVRMARSYGADQLRDSYYGLATTVMRRLCINEARAAQARYTTSARGSERRVAQNLSLDLVDGNLLNNLPEPDADPAIIFENKEAVQAGLEAVSSEHRAVLEECFMRGRSHLEAAEKLNLPIGTVKSRMHYALRSLRKELTKLGYNPESEAA